MDWRGRKKYKWSGNSLILRGLDWDQARKKLFNEALLYSRQCPRHQTVTDEEDMVPEPGALRRPGNRQTMTGTFRCNQAGAERWHMQTAGQVGSFSPAHCDAATVRIPLGRRRNQASLDSQA